MSNSKLNALALSLIPMVSREESSPESVAFARRIRNMLAAFIALSDAINRKQSAENHLQALDAFSAEVMRSYQSKQDMEKDLRFIDWLLSGESGADEGGKS